MKAIEISPGDKNLFSEKRKGNRRKTIRRASDRARIEGQAEKVRKLHSLLELGQLIGFDFELNEMLLKIAQKAAEVMEADRCSLFLYDPKTSDLWSAVALGMGEQVIRIPSGTGVAGYCFKTGEVVNLQKAYDDPQFNKEVDLRTGYHTQSLLCMPLHNRDGKMGVIQLLNKKDGIFTEEDETFLETFGNHASVFIEIAQLQKARFEALEESRVELERLNKAKSKALDHLSHELRTPLAVIQGNLKLLKRKLEEQNGSLKGSRFFETLQKHLDRIGDIHQEAETMMRSDKETKMEALVLFSIVEQTVEKAKKRSSHRNLRFLLEGLKDLFITMDRRILEGMVEGLLKNAIENTPDEGLVRVLFEQKASSVFLKVQDFGIGITADNQRSIFDGFFYTQETDLYTSKSPYDFYAGGKGLDLHRMKIYGQRFGFDLSMESRRCAYLPTDRDLCPGRISACPHCRGADDCLSSGGSTFCLSFPKRG